MAFSAAQMAANRRNAQKSTWPRIAEGKNKSKLNEVTHGMRARTPVLPGEDALELSIRFEAWNEALAPTDAVEQSLVHDAVEYTWQVDRARNAQVARIEFNIENFGRDEAKREADEVFKLGQRLFWDPRGPLSLFPHFDCLNAKDPRTVDRVSEPPFKPEPFDPPRLLMHLESTPAGCRWLLDQWAELRSILEKGQKWLPPDKLKAIRLLGRQPLEAVDDSRVLIIFVACQAVEECPGTIIPEIVYELWRNERPIYAQRLADRGIADLMPKDAAAGRQALLEIVDTAVKALQTKADEHRRRDEVNAALLADCLTFDDSKEGERLRRYELAASRGIARSLETLLKLRRKGAQPGESQGVDKSLFPEELALVERIEDTEIASQAANTGSEVSDIMDVAAEPIADVQILTSEPISDVELSLADAVDADPMSADETRNTTTEPIGSGDFERFNADDVEQTAVAETESTAVEPIFAGDCEVPETADIVHETAAELKNTTVDSNSTKVVPENGSRLPRHADANTGESGTFGRTMTEARESRNPENRVGWPRRVPARLVEEARALQWLPGDLVQKILAASRDDDASAPGESGTNRVNDS